MDHRHVWETMWNFHNNASTREFKEILWNEPEQEHMKNM